MKYILYFNLSHFLSFSNLDTDELCGKWSCFEFQYQEDVLFYSWILLYTSQEPQIQTVSDILSA